MIVALAGRRVDAADASPPRFPLANVDMVAQSLRDLFDREHVSAVVCSAACGADLVALREAAALNLRTRIVLPFDRAAFRASSVTDRPGDWGPVYDRILDQRAAAGDVVTLSHAQGDAAYAATNTAILDEARALSQQTGEAMVVVLVWDGVSRGDGDLTAEFGSAAARRNVRVLEVLSVKTCFVVQGFGNKADLATGRVLNLDASYDVIKEAVEAAGLRCVRADEIVHSGTIDKPMYEWLFKADLVIADLSTSNPNAVYELGVRHALRPYTTIIVAESQFKNPFDVNHTITRFYEHLGADLGRLEAKRFSKALTADVKRLLEQTGTDSPVYTYLEIQPPTDKPKEVASMEAAFGFSAEPEEPAVEFTPQPLDGSAKELLDKARAALEKDQFPEAKALFGALRVMRPRDVYITQQLALATYKSKLPDPVGALKEAHGYLLELGPDSSNDPETIGLWGAIHKRLWDATHDRAFLNSAIAAYERGFYLKQDYYNGINYAFLLNVRAALFKQEGIADEATADFVLARRVRTDVLRYCDQALAAPSLDPTTKYWILATKWEAATGIGDAALVEKLRLETEALTVPGWMLTSTRQQLKALEELL